MTALAQDNGDEETHAKSDAAVDDDEQSWQIKYGTSQSA